MNYEEMNHETTILVCSNRICFSFFFVKLTWCTVMYIEK